MVFQCMGFPSLIIFLHIIDFDIDSTDLRINVNKNSTVTRLIIVNDLVTEGIEFLTLTLAGGYVEGMTSANVASAGKHTTVFIEDDDGNKFIGTNIEYEVPSSWLTV